ncbi:hypothetical protein BLNAU_11938 [Blattamonas nauphoetae]|uniref:Uncharacterized protein n=1 Tax=Blattamonas nauphoetae TaxID=2049346 RepID=A0ABQ9XL42_9EUKA|nr:hypothetical protein BLNAU_11938 [Blattamonas nauphoetae]
MSGRSINPLLLSRAEQRARPDTSPATSTFSFADSPVIRARTAKQLTQRQLHIQSLSLRESAKKSQTSRTFSPTRSDSPASLRRSISPNLDSERSGQSTAQTNINLPSELTPSHVSDSTDYIYQGGFQGSATRPTTQEPTRRRQLTSPDIEREKMRMTSKSQTFLDNSTSMTIPHSFRTTLPQFTSQIPVDLPVSYPPSVASIPSRNTIQPQSKTLRMTNTPISAPKEYPNSPMTMKKVFTFLSKHDEEGEVPVSRRNSLTPTDNSSLSPHSYDSPVLRSAHLYNQPLSPGPNGSFAKTNADMQRRLAKDEQIVADLKNNLETLSKGQREDVIQYTPVPPLRMTWQLSANDFADLAQVKFLTDVNTPFVDLIDNNTERLHSSVRRRRLSSREDLRRSNQFAVTRERDDSTIVRQPTFLSSNSTIRVGYLRRGRLPSSNVPSISRSHDFYPDGRAERKRSMSLDRHPKFAPPKQNHKSVFGSTVDITRKDSVTPTRKTIFAELTARPKKRRAQQYHPLEPTDSKQYARKSKIRRSLIESTPAELMVQQLLDETHPSHSEGTQRRTHTFTPHHTSPHLPQRSAQNSDDDFDQDKKSSTIASPHQSGQSHPSHQDSLENPPNPTSSSDDSASITSDPAIVTELSSNSSLEPRPASQSSSFSEVLQRKLGHSASIPQPISVDEIHETSPPSSQPRQSHQLIPDFISPKLPQSPSLGRVNVPFQSAPSPRRSQSPHSKKSTVEVISTIRQINSEINKQREEAELDLVEQEQWWVEKTIYKPPKKVQQFIFEVSFIFYHCL